MYESISSPNVPSVVRRKPWSIGVPVKPMNVALGSAARIFAARRPYCVRCASSIITTTLSAALRCDASPMRPLSASSNFWIVVITVRPLLVPSSARRWAVLSACSGLGKPVRSNVCVI